MFASRTLIEHIVRGVIGIAALAAAIWLAQRADALGLIGSIVLALVALIAWRGCPLCWLTGLVETLRGKDSRANP